MNDLIAMCQYAPMKRPLPIACSLDGGEARRRWLRWDGILKDRLSAERTRHELRVRFKPDPVLRAELEGLMVAERDCCGFVNWSLAESANELLLSITGESEGVAAIDEAFQLGE